MMKRLTAALLAAALFLTLTGCADASERQSRKTALRILRGDDLGYQLSTGTAVENQEVYNDGSIVIQLGGISGTPDDPQLVLAVKNGSRKEITFTPQRCFINGWQTDCWSDVYEIAGHSTITATVSISSDSLYDSDSYESIELTDSDTLTYTLQISDSDSNVQLLTQEVTLTLADLQ